MVTEIGRAAGVRYARPSDTGWRQSIRFRQVSADALGVYSFLLDQGIARKRSPSPATAPVAG
jgi:hypothetical protein